MNKYLLIGLAVMIAGAAGNFLGQNLDGETIYATVPSDYKKPFEQMTQDEVDAAMHEQIVSGHATDMEGSDDPAFVAWVTNVLDKTCPYYEPNGALYRDCLLDIVEEKERSYTKKSPTLEEIKKICDLYAFGTGNLLRIQILASCEIYKLSGN